MFYGKKEIMFLLECKEAKAYQVIRELSNELLKKGYCRPPHGKIQKVFFCENYMLDVRECDESYNNYINQNNLVASK